MERPRVLIRSNDETFRTQLKIKIDAKFVVSECRLGEPVGDNAEFTPQPDIVVIRFENGDSSTHLTKETTRWPSGTCFVVVGVVNPVTILGRRPMVCYAVQNEEVISAIDEAAAKCWAGEFNASFGPCCQLNAAGQVLRANDAMKSLYGTDILGVFFRHVVEKTRSQVFPVDHPIRQCREQGIAVQDLVTCSSSILQLVCLPDREVSGPSGTVTVLISDIGRRKQVFDSASVPRIGSLTELNEYILKCATDLGYSRTRLYLFSADGNELVGTACTGYDLQRAEWFLRFNAHVDITSTDTIRLRIPVLCIHDPKGECVGIRSELVRVNQDPPNFQKELGMTGVHRWIDAPLIVPGGGSTESKLLGRLVVDREEESDQLTLQDALDVGLLAMTAAGALHTFQEQEHAAWLVRRKTRFLTELLEVLPLFATEPDDTKFYRCIAVILSCHVGLRWDRVMLFLVDSAGLKQASCVMALGGVTNRMSFSMLRHYVEDALTHPKPDDNLYEQWVSDLGEHKTISFGTHAPSNPIADLLALNSTSRWTTIDVNREPWCQTVNEQFPGTFIGSRLLAFPLTKSFALDVEFGIDSERTQPVGVALVGKDFDSATDSPDCTLTRTTLDLVGAMIAQRWTTRRIRGTLGALSTVHHSGLKDSWVDVMRAMDEWSTAHDDEQRKASYLKARDAHDEMVQHIQITKTTMARTLRQYSDSEVDIFEFFAVNAQSWLREWGKRRGLANLQLELNINPEPRKLRCEPFVLRDALTCLIENSVAVATERELSSVTVQISTKNRQQYPDYEIFEIDVADNAGGIAPVFESLLFVKGASMRQRGTGYGLALARTQLLMHSGDLRYLGQHGLGGAHFQIVFFRRNVDVEKIDRKQAMAFAGSWKIKHQVAGHRGTKRVQNPLILAEVEPEIGSTKQLLLPAGSIDHPPSPGIHINSLRAFWRRADDWRRLDRISLAVLHGIVERIPGKVRATISPVFFQMQLDQIQTNTSDPLTIEHEASMLGLPVLDSEEPPFGIEAYFGNVEEIDGSLARIELLDQTDNGIQCVTSVPVNVLPMAYRHEGAGVAWVERQYVSGAKGRFEPASDLT